MSFVPSTVVVIDDHLEWRQHVTATVERTGAWKVVGEGADGQEGCAIVAALKPDLILLDIELPKLNGFDTATQILADDPSARILFLSGHGDWDVIEAALMTGARGYVLKNFAGSELGPAMSAIAAGGRFLSAAAGGRAGAAGDRHEPHTHDAGIYTTDASLEADYEAFVADGVAAGKTVVGVMHAERRHQLRRGLIRRGLDIDRAIADDRYIEIDVAEMLGLIITDGLPDESRVWGQVVPLMARAARVARTAPPALAAFGDCAQTLWNMGEPSAAILLEQYWNEISKTVNLDLLCGYRLPAFEAEDEETRGLVSAVHTATRRR
jgi:DNA-binding NarL/FixJ family response regulator